jgi:hypothetical protein
MQKVNVTKIIGFILLSPAILSVVLFLIDILAKSQLELFDNLHYMWSGAIEYNGDGGGGGYSSALPLYFGLMAIAGSYLIKDK